MMELFPDAYLMPYPNGTGITENCKTKVCGRKKGCECVDNECNVRCNMQTDMKHLKLYDIGDMLI